MPAESAASRCRCRRPAAAGARPSNSKLLGILSYPFLCALGLGYVTALLAIVLGVVGLVQSFRPGAPSGGRAQAVTGLLLGLVLVTGTTLLALPGVLAARVRANEAAAIGDPRAIVQAEVEYSRANGDLYDTLECLSAPARCLPAFDANRPPFIAPTLVAPRRMGYTRSFHAGAAPRDRPRGASPSSLTRFAVVAVPSSPGWSGRRSFCADGTGRVCAQEGPPPTVVEGKCAPSCPDLR